MLPAASALRKPLRSPDITLHDRSSFQVSTMKARAPFWWALGAAMLAWIFSRTEAGSGAIQRVIDMALPRGIRNNNPGNIERTGDRWRGMSAIQSDPRYVVFDAPVWGLRAMARIIRNYMRQGCDTIERIITRWAPPSENVTSAYIAAVSRHVGKAPNAPLTEADLIPLMEAITRHENGMQPYDRSLFAEAIALERQT